MGIRERQRALMQAGAASVTKWVGSTTSVVVHTLIFIVSFILPELGLVSFERMLLFLTTIVSLEAIYLSIFIQMSINMNNQNIELIQDDIVELGEGIEEISEDIEDISEDIEEISEDIEDISEDIEEMGEDIEEIQKDVDELQEDVGEIQEEVTETEEEAAQEEAEENKDTELLLSIQATLLALQKEIEQLKSSGK